MVDDEVGVAVIVDVCSVVSGKVGGIVSVSSFVVCGADVVGVIRNASAVVDISVANDDSNVVVLIGVVVSLVISGGCVGGLTVVGASVVVVLSVVC